ncbi:uncharacterized protein FOMMEDRAFT_88136 [Fomitiporia mediterranea MF3/22]|uniref:uncharacterized protein n=1 Tax=Fomitiporia mediterranea (strain MF3/22) TaxID=694068 RepID=UPI00044091D8|nr:uncharacterized protein FOMMEDRAFT_88136 [Fomitiporia mediterranea MF3/22]EJD01798.1 hypothetical protein FOMMEDRAFT_88136 [Fomitiporia mediterranea MF3/22]
MLPSLPRLSQLASMPFKRAQTGLLHGKLIQFGNNVPFSKHKTRRTWLPNIQRKGLRSELLDRELTLKVSTRALKTIKKMGGLDQYILKTRHELLGPEGMRIRLLLREKQEKLAQQTLDLLAKQKARPSASSSAAAARSIQEKGARKDSGTRAVEEEKKGGNSGRRER